MKKLNRTIVSLLWLLCLRVDASVVTWAKAYWDVANGSSSTIRMLRDPQGGYDLLYSNHVIRISEQGEILFQRKIIDYYGGFWTLVPTREGGFAIAGGHDWLEDSDT